MDPITVGTREFRQNLSAYLLESGIPVAITRHANKHFTLKTNTLTRADLGPFVLCYNPANRHQRILAAEIMKDLQAALHQFAQIASDLAAVGRSTPGD